MKLIEEPVDGVPVDPIVVAQPVETPVEQPASPTLLIQPLPEPVEKPDVLDLPIQPVE